MDAWDDGLLDSMRTVADPLADETVQALFRDGQVAAVNLALEHLSSNSESPPEGLPPILLRFLDSSGQMPTDLNWERIDRGQQLFTRHGPIFGVALMYASLPALYAGARGGVQILAMTGQLKNHYRRRASETLRFILDVMKPGGLSPAGQGVRSAQKVRLMHATIRYFARTSGRWAALPEWGAPINQEELAGTLMAFSVLASDNVQRMGITLTEGEAEDYQHAWHAVGHILGISESLRPLKLPAARALWRQMGERNFARTKEGVSLAHDHLAFLDEMIPGKALDGFNSALMRFLMGDPIAVTCLGLAPASWWQGLIRVLRKLLGMAELFVPARAGWNYLIADINLRIMDELQKYWAGKGSAPFRLPTQLEKPS